MNKVELNYAKLRWLTDSSGVIHDDDVATIPDRVKEWFEPVAEYAYNNVASYPYLVKGEDGSYGVMAILEYVHPESTYSSECYADLVKGTELASAKDGQPLLEHLQNFSKTMEDENVFVNGYTGFNGNHELGIYIPAFTDIEKVKEIINKLEKANVIPVPETN